MEVTIILATRMIIKIMTIIRNMLTNAKMAKIMLMMMLLAVLMMMMMQVTH